MNDLTLESLAKRVEALEEVIATKRPESPRKDWRKVVGMFGDGEFMPRKSTRNAFGCAARPSGRRPGVGELAE